MDVNFLIGIFKYFGSLIDKLPTQFFDQGSVLCAVVREPLSTPPLIGCLLILVRRSYQPSALQIVEILQTVLPENVVQTVPGLGPEVPQALVSHPKVNMVSSLVLQPQDRLLARQLQR